ncbi:MAG: hypothetical protein FWF55_04085 [Treponema sp.]|nr:hypothetical protein [Treponema sp.]
MKKSKILVVGLIGLLMAGGLVMAGCDEPGCSNDGKCEYQTAVLDGYYGSSSGVDNVCGDSDCNVYKQKYSGGATARADCNCFH